MNNSDIENKVQEELEAFRSCCGFEIGGEMSVMCDIDDLDQLIKDNLYQLRIHLGFHLSHC